MISVLDRSRLKLSKLYTSKAQTIVVTVQVYLLNNCKYNKLFSLLLSKSFKNASHPTELRKILRIGGEYLYLVALPFAEK